MFKQWVKIVCVIAMIGSQPVKNRGAFVAVALIAAVPLLVLAAAAPGGSDWRTLEYPRHITLLAVALGTWACFGRTWQRALLTLAATVVIALVWEVIEEYSGLSKFGRTDLLSSEMKLLVDLSVARAAPWVVGGAYAILAWLACARSRDPLVSRRTAGAWLVAIALVALAIPYSNESWLTLENLSERGTYRSSSPWPDTKKLSLVVDLIAVAAGVAFIVYRRRDNRLPKATLRND